MGFLVTGDERLAGDSPGASDVKRGLPPFDIESHLITIVGNTFARLAQNANSVFVPNHKVHRYLDAMEFVEYRLLLGSHIQSIRKARGLTQEQVAERIGMDRVSIGYIEQGKRTPKVSTLYALSQCYDVEMQELFPRDDSPDEIAEKDA